MKGFIRLSHFKTLLYLGVFLGLIIMASIVTGKQQTIILLCPGEQRITLMCSTNHTFLEWSVSSLRQPETRAISYFDQNLIVPPILMDSTNFTFSRVSSPGALPLVSTMTVMNVTSNLEETVITCTGLNSSSVSSVVLMTTIHVYDMHIDFPNTPEIIRPDMVSFGNSNFTVTLEWSQFSGETYTVATVPDPVNMSFITSTSVQLVLFYNTQYNVTVTATLCGDSNATTISYYYGLDPVTPTVDCSCGAPQFTRNSNIGVNFTEMPSMEQNQNSTFITAIVISTIIAYILSSVLIFIIGCVCGWFGHKHKAKGLDESTHSQATPWPGPVYEDLQSSTSMPGDPWEKATFELKENVAYGPVPVRST